VGVQHAEFKPLSVNISGATWRGLARSALPLRADDLRRTGAALMHTPVDLPAALLPAR